MLKKLFITSLLSIVLINSGTAQDHNTHKAGEMEGVEHMTGHEKEFSMDQMIMHHVLDEHGWEFAHGVKIPLPIILYTADRKVELFSSAKLDHGQTY
ncbi:MAG: F0F1 ATP synthase subunit A, partial [Spirosomataceae bacterium]